jgi:hypothetical protein
MAEKNPFFATKPDDPKDVSWGLSTADACWRRGERREALKWLRRAVESASEAEADDRALELAKIAADLATQIGTVAPPPMEPTPRAAPLIQASPVIPRAPAVPGKGPLPAKPAGPLPARAPAAKEPAREPAKKPDRKSITNEGGPRSKAAPLVGKLTDKARPGGHAHEKADHKGHDKAAHAKPDSVPPPRKRSTSRADREEAAPSRTQEIDEWPTEVLSGKDLGATSGELAPVPPAPGSGTDVARPRNQVAAAQAVRVLVWRDLHGLVQVVAAGGGRDAPSSAMEATLVAGDATADLLSLLGE